MFRRKSMLYWPFASARGPRTARGRHLDSFGRFRLRAVKAAAHIPGAKAHGPLASGTTPEGVLRA